MRQEQAAYESGNLSPQTFTIPQKRGGCIDMKQYKWPDIGNCIRTIGRTFYEEKSGVLYMNWTCTGIEFIFKGTCLIADLCAFNGEEDEVVWVPDLGGGTESTPGVVKRHQEKRKTWPVAAGCSCWTIGFAESISILSAQISVTY